VQNGTIQKHAVGLFRLHHKMLMADIGKKKASAKGERSVHPL
jgi:hypothetical protein